MFKNNDQTKPQFVCSTQPLALLLSRDSFLCFDGDSYGLYYPWRSHKMARKEVDPEYRRYLEKKGAFEIPHVHEQRRLVRIFLEKIYPLYPVVERDIISELPKVPLLLMNALVLAATRFDTTLDPKKIRARLGQVFERCKLLETVEQNKVVLIQSYVLLLMHEEGMEGITSSKEYIAKACNLCGELAITNMGGSDSRPFPNLSDDNYSKNLLTRIFWTTFCCDRMVSATSGREMIFSRSDLIINEISPEHFKDGPEKNADFAIFHSWLSLAVLVERIQSAMYRPPGNRAVDTKLHQDISNWKAPVIPDRMSDMTGFLRVAHCYTSLLFLRSEMDSLSFLLNDLSAAENKVLEIKRVSQHVLSLLTPEIVHNVLVVHAVLHIIALAQFEAKFHGDLDPTTELGKYYTSVTGRSLDCLGRLKDYWWFASTALVLCQTVFEVGSKK